MFYFRVLRESIILSIELRSGLPHSDLEPLGGAPPPDYEGIFKATGDFRLGREYIKLRTSELKHHFPPTPLPVHLGRQMHCGVA